MSTNNVDQTEILFTESPASWNTRYVTEDGFTCQLTLRSESGKELLERANGALAYLREQGCTPVFGYSNGNGYQRKGNQAHNNNASSNDDGWCTTHDVEMRRREKDGQVWYSHKAPDGSWCKGS